MSRFLKFSLAPGRPLNDDWLGVLLDKLLASMVHRARRDLDQKVVGVGVTFFVTGAERARAIGVGCIANADHLDSRVAVPLAWIALANGRRFYGLTKDALSAFNARDVRQFEAELARAHRSSDQIAGYLELSRDEHRWIRRYPEFEGIGAPGGDA
jgi:hypothetical protein